MGEAETTQRMQKRARATGWYIIYREITRMEKGVRIKHSAERGLHSRKHFDQTLGFILSILDIDLGRDWCSLRVVMRDRGKLVRHSHSACSLL